MFDNNSIKFDLPLSNIEHDLLGRKQLVDLIISSINGTIKQNHPCVVYGIYGKWGVGKTTILNFIEERLKSQGPEDGINIVRFNPWIVDNNDALLHEFFNTLCTNPIEDISTAFRQYGSWAIFLSKAFIPIVGDRVADGIELATKALDDARPTLAQSKQKVSETIKNSKRHIVVIIDDVDRLDNEELHKIFQLVRQVADFENCIYILAMDADMVAKSIGHYHGSESTNDGWDFLNKIIQIPIILPQISNSNMSLLVKNELNSLLKLYCTQHDINNIVNEVTPFISTIRDLKRYCNQLRFVLPLLKDEVDFFDLCVLEGIKNVSVEAYYRIYYSQSLLLQKVNYEQKLQIDKLKNFKPVYESALDYITGTLEAPLKDLVKSAVESLFHIRYIDAKKNIVQKYIANESHFFRYFALHVPSDLISDKELDVIILQLNDMDVDNVISLINMWYSRCAIAEIKRASIYMLNNYEENKIKLFIASKIAVALSLSSITNEYGLDSDELSVFVSNEIILKYMFRDKLSCNTLDRYLIRYIQYDSDLLDKTFNQIFQRAEINYCLQLMYLADEIFSSASYKLGKVIDVLIKRFKEIEYKLQFSFAKPVLKTFYRSWKAYEEDSFNEYVISLFNSTDYSYIGLMDTLIGSEDNIDDVVFFVNLFENYIPQIVECLSKEQSDYNRASVKFFFANYQQILKKR